MNIMFGIVTTIKNSTKKLMNKRAMQENVPLNNTTLINILGGCALFAIIHHISCVDF
jgi:hypothetical protein